MNNRGCKNGDTERTSGDVGAFVVPPEQEKVLGVLDFITQKQEDGLQALFPPVHVIA